MPCKLDQTVRVHAGLGEVGHTESKPVLILELVWLQYDVLEPRWFTITHDSYRVDSLQMKGKMMYWAYDRACAAYNIVSNLWALTIRT